MSNASRESLVVTVPGDKSITHRALMFAALATGQSRLSGLLSAEDPRSTAAVLRQLGADVPPLPAGGDEIVVEGRGLRGLSAPAAPLDCGNSGTTARLMMGILAAQPFSATLTGDPSLRSRPMRRVTEPLSRMGARFEEEGEVDRLPIRVSGGPLRSIEYDSPKSSAQVKSAVLLAGLVGGVPVTVREPLLSRDHTERMLRSMGATVESGRDDGSHVARLFPPPALRPLDLRVPGDFSSAAFLLALAALSPAGSLRLPGVGTNPGRTGFLAVLERMGGRVALENEELRSDETVADLVADGGTPLGAATVTGVEVPAMVDEVPLVAVLGARAEGETRITGAGELRVKESDRIALVVSNLRAIGAEAWELPDGLVVRGGHVPLAGRVVTRGDHRIAMAFGVLGALAGNDIVVDDPECVAVSFPGFWDVLRRAAEALGA